VRLLSILSASYLNLYLLRVQRARSEEHFLIDDEDDRRAGFNPRARYSIEKMARLKAWIYAVLTEP
jgi:hypothetical protein